MSLNTLGIIKNGTKIKIPAVFVPEPQESVSVTADGVKTWGELLNELLVSIDSSKMTDNSLFVLNSGLVAVINNRLSNAYRYSCLFISNNQIVLQQFELRSNDSVFYQVSGTSFSNRSSEKPVNGRTLTIYY